MSTTMAKKETVQRTGYVSTPRASPWAAPPSLPPSCCAASTSPTSPPTLTAATSSSSSTSDKAVLTGKKGEQKLYQHHTGWIGNLKEVKYRLLMEERPEFAMELAVKGMLPKNSLGRAALTRLKLYKGAEHNNAAQKPVAWTQD